MNTAIATKLPQPRLARRRNAQKSVGRLVLYAVLLTFAAYFVMPLVVMIFASFKDMAEIRSTSILTVPLSPTAQPWIDAWQRACVGVDCVGLRGFYLKTILIVVPAVILSTLLGALNGYALTKFDFRGSRLVYGLILFGSFTPYQAVLIPLAKTLGFLGLSGSISGLVLVHTVYGLPFTTMFFRNYFMTVPQDLVKAARVDGAGFWGTFWHIILPLSVPMIVVTVIWQFTSIWNDFLFGVSFTSGQNTPIMVALNNMVSASAGERPYNVHMAAALLAALPTLVIYALAGKYFVRGLMAGAVKG